MKNKALNKKDATRILGIIKMAMENMRIKNHQDKTGEIRRACGIVLNISYTIDFNIILINMII